MSVLNATEFTLKITKIECYMHFIAIKNQRNKKVNKTQSLPSESSLNS